MLRASGERLVDFGHDNSRISLIYAPLEYDGARQPRTWRFAGFLYEHPARLPVFYSCAKACYLLRGGDGVHILTTSERNHCVVFGEHAIAVFSGVGVVKYFSLLALDWNVARVADQRDPTPDGVEGVASTTVERKEEWRDERWRSIDRKSLTCRELVDFYEPVLRFIDSDSDVEQTPGIMLHAHHDAALLAQTLDADGRRMLVKRNGHVEISERRSSESDLAQATCAPSGRFFLVTPGGKGGYELLRDDTVEELLRCCEDEEAAVVVDGGLRGDDDDALRVKTLIRPTNVDSVDAVPPLERACLLPEGLASDLRSAFAIAPANSSRRCMTLERLKSAVRLTSRTFLRVETSDDEDDALRRSLTRFAQWRFLERDEQNAVVRPQIPPWRRRTQRLRELTETIGNATPLLEELLRQDADSERLRTCYQTEIEKRLAGWCVLVCFFSKSNRTRRSSSRRSSTKRAIAVDAATYLWLVLYDEFCQVYTNEKYI